MLFVELPHKIIWWY